MTFERPELLAYLPGAVVLWTAAVGWRWRRSLRLVRAYGGPDAARRLTGRALHRFPVARLLCALFAAAALLSSAAGIRRDAGEPPPPPTPVDLIVALDLSHSMTAADVRPSRIARGRAAVQAVVEARVAERAGLTVFAGWPYGLVPLTDDLTVVDYFVPWAAPELLEGRDQGTALPAVVGHAVRAWQARAREGAVPVLLIVSDGEAHATAAETLDSVRVAVEAGLRIWTAGVGTADGAPLFVSGSSAPLLEASGAQAVAGYEPDLLRDVARLGGGAFHDVGGDGGVEALVADLRALGGSSGPEEGEDFDPAALLILIGLALLAAEAVLDSGALATGAWRHARGGGS